jgi:hypothetical protein
VSTSSFEEAAHTVTYGRTHYNGKSILPMRPNMQMSSDVADPDSGAPFGFLYL